VRRVNLNHQDAISSLWAVWKIGDESHAWLITSDGVIVCVLTLDRGHFSARAE
jgi:hypothetical protein